MTSGRARGGTQGRDERYIIEFYQVGAYVKVSAVDPATLTEVCIVGDPLAGEAVLEQTVLRKLAYVLKRQRAPRR